MTIYRLGLLLSQFGSSPLFHAQFELLLPDLHTDFSGGRSGCLWYSHHFKNFPQYMVIQRVKGFGRVNKAEVDVFLELSCFFYDPADDGDLISDSSAFSQSSLDIWKFTSFEAWLGVF